MPVILFFSFRQIMTHLIRNFHSNQSSTGAVWQPCYSASNFKDCVLLADEAQEAEAVQVLNSIYDMREHQSNRQPEDMATVCHALAMLYFVLKDLNKVGSNLWVPHLQVMKKLIGQLDS